MGRESWLAWHLCIYVALCQRPFVVHTSQSSHLWNQGFGIRRKECFSCEKGKQASASWSVTLFPSCGLLLQTVHQSMTRVHFGFETSPFSNQYTGCNDGHVFPSFTVGLPVNSAPRVSLQLWEFFHFALGCDSDPLSDDYVFFPALNSICLKVLKRNALNVWLFISCGVGLDIMEGGGPLYYHWRRGRVLCPHHLFLPHAFLVGESIKCALFLIFRRTYMVGRGERRRI